MNETSEMSNYEEVEAWDAYGSPYGDLVSPASESEISISLEFGDEDSDHVLRVGEFLDVAPSRGSLSESMDPHGPVFIEGFRREETPSPAPSYESMHSDDGDVENRPKVSEESVVTRVQLEMPDSPASSCHSAESEESNDNADGTERRPKARSCPRHALRQHSSQEQPTLRPELQTLLAASEKRHPAMTVGFMFKSLQACLRRLVAEDLALFKSLLRDRYPDCFENPMKEYDVIDLVDKILERCGLQGALRITLQTLKDIKLTNIADYLQELCNRNEAQYELKLSLKRKYECIFEGVAKQGNQTNFSSVFSELHITEGGHAGVNQEHELRVIEPLRKKARKQVTVMTCSDIFSAASVATRHTRSVLSKGVAGIGKSVAVQKFIVDWANGKDHQDVYFLFPIPFRELNLMQAGPYSLMQIIHSFFPEMKALNSLDCDECRVLFICDGLDEYQLPLDFRCNECWCDMTLPTSVDMLVTNLIKGNLLPAAHIWITSRPCRTSRIPPESIHQLVEIRGFTDPQKDQYFQKKFADTNVADRILAHVKSSRSLYIMCHIPLFCWITASVCGAAFRRDGGAEPPSTITPIFTHFLLIQLNAKKQRYGTKGNGNESAKEFLMKLGKLAFRMLEKGKVTLTKAEWAESGIDLTEAIGQSGLCTEVYKEEFVMYHEKLFCFVHLTIQEYLAALYVFLSFKNGQKNVFDQPHQKLSRLVKRVSLFELHKSAIDKAMQSDDGHFELFLRFLLGLSGESVQNQLRGQLIQSDSGPQSTEETVKYIKEKMKKHREWSTKLSLCLDELTL